MLDSWSEPGEDLESEGVNGSQLGGRWGFGVRGWLRGGVPQGSAPSLQPGGVHETGVRRPLKTNRKTKIENSNQPRIWWIQAQGQHFFFLECTLHYMWNSILQSSGTPFFLLLCFVIMLLRLSLRNMHSSCMLVYGLCSFLFIFRNTFFYQLWARGDLDVNFRGCFLHFSLENYFYYNLSMRRVWDELFAPQNVI